MPDRYTKPALDFRQQLSHLKAKGLQSSNDEQALRQLAVISYYRLSAYWYPFRVRDAAGNVTSQFVDGTTFDQVIALYEFDRRLRSLVLNALEHIEVAVRTRLAYHMGHRYGTFGHTDSANFHPKFDHARWLSNLESETERSSDEFIRHYRNKYAGFPTVPIWMLTEVMSFGALSFFYRGLRNDRRQGVEDKRKVADYFGVHYRRLGNWLHTLTYVRNVCAHHSRLWNRELAIRPDRSREPDWLPPLTPRNDRIFYILLILRYLLRPLGNDNHWVTSVTTLLEPVATEPGHRIAMGMPENWKEHPIWK